MKFGFLINDVGELRPTQTTSMLLAYAARAGHDAFAIPIDALQIASDGRVCAYARPVAARADIAVTLDLLNRRRPEILDLGALDALLVRTNPARDHRMWAHDMGLECAALLEQRGVFVANRPAALRRSMSKMTLARLPSQVVPKTLVTRDFGALEQFLRAAPGDIVLKPLAGTRGQDVFRIDRDRAPNLRQIFDVTTRDGYCVAQHFIPDAVNGDVRLVLLDGRPLEVNGQVAAVRRVPGERDFRSNIAVGGKASPVVVTDEMRAVADEIGPRLADEGLWLVGLDLIGEQTVEVNVFSTGGLNHAEEFYGVRFVEAILDWVVTQIST